MSDTSKEQLLVRILGLVCILAGLTLNIFFFNAISPDGDLEGVRVRSAIWIFDVVMVLSGIAILRFRPRIPQRYFAAAAVLALVALVGLETAFRSGRLGERYGTQQLVSGIGWETKPNQDRILSDPVYGKVRYRTDERGFRLYGDTATSRIKIFFIGDSFTQGNQVPDGEQFYYRMEEMRDDIEVFAYGVSGYSTLQEFMILDRWFDRIRPDIVIFQLSPTDIMESSWELESQSAYNTMTTRPYWEDGRIVERFPSRNPLVRSSHMIRYVAERLGFLGHENDRFVKNSIDYRVDETRPLWDQAIATMTEVLRMSRERAKGASFAAFEVAPEGPAGPVFPQILRDAGVPHLTGVPEAEDAAVAAGLRTSYAPLNSHWNELGHELAARTILSWLVGQEWLPPVAVKPDSD